MEKILNVAEYIFKEYQRVTGEYIDEMKLQKLLYFSQRESLAILNKPMFSEKFEGWYTMIGIFNKTEIIVHLAQEYLDFPMVSRSLARRILSNIDKFKVVFLDFANIETIGQGFADEIFRVFKNKHPEISIIPLNTNEEIDFMIKRATNTKF